MIKTIIRALNQPTWQKTKQGYMKPTCGEIEDGKKR